MDPAREPNPAAADDGMLDSYSETVMRVATTVTPTLRPLK